MKKRFSAVLVTGLFLLTLTGLAQAALTTIGTAGYDSDHNGTIESDENYNLIYDADGPLGPVTWLDYSHPRQSWNDQIIWAATLGDKLTVTLNPGYTTSISWLVGWRLPSAGANPQYGLNGLNQTTSEMGDLFYNGLGLTAYSSYATTAQLNATNFDNLIASWYWSGTEFAYDPEFAWVIYMGDGYQNSYYKHGMDVSAYGLAIHSGQVSAVPVPGAIWLFGSGLAGLVALSRRRKGNCV